MTLNGVMAITMRYFTEFSKPAFQLITASSSIELIDQKSAFITHRTVKLVCVTKFTHSLLEWMSSLLTFNLSCKFRFTLLSCCDLWCLASGLQKTLWCASLLYFVVRVRCRRKKFTFAISSSDELLVNNFPALKEFWKLVSIWPSYRRELMVHLVYMRRSFRDTYCKFTLVLWLGYCMWASISSSGQFLWHILSSSGSASSRQPGRRVAPSARRRQKGHAPFTRGVNPPTCWRCVYTRQPMADIVKSFLLNLANHISLWTCPGVLH